jgi:hypothetical protein
LRSLPKRAKEKWEATRQQQLARRDAAKRKKPAKRASEHGGSTTTGARGLPSSSVSNPSESYARAITNNIKIEEFRLAANDRARLALQIYAEECNSLNRHKIHKIYNGERERHFNRTLVEAIKYAHKYSQLLDEHGLKLQIFEPTPECWFESLVVLIEQTNNPFDAVEVDNFDVLLESYYKEHFHIKRKKVGYAPLSKII